jgi:hypothetical protein
MIAGTVYVNQVVFVGVAVVAVSMVDAVERAVGVAIVADVTILVVDAAGAV